MHSSVGAIIKNAKGEILLIDRATFPFGWACPAGHIDEGETPEKALRREAKEETGLMIKDYRLLFHEFVPWNECFYGETGHDWHVFEISDCEGEVKKNLWEVKSIKWVAPEDIKDLDLEEVWKYWFKKLSII